MANPTMAEVIAEWAVQVLCEEAQYAFDKAKEQPAGGGRSVMEEHGLWLLSRAADRAELTIKETAQRYGVKNS